jgi:hypothetical protein
LRDVEGPQCIDSRLIVGGKVVKLYAPAALYPKKILVVLNSVRG